MHQIQASKVKICIHQILKAKVFILKVHQLPSVINQALFKDHSKIQTNKPRIKLIHRCQELTIDFHHLPWRQR